MAGAHRPSTNHKAFWGHHLQSPPLLGTDLKRCFKKEILLQLNIIILKVWKCIINVSPRPPWQSPVSVHLSWRRTCGWVPRRRATERGWSTFTLSDSILTQSWIYYSSFNIHYSIPAHHSTLKGRKSMSGTCIFDIWTWKFLKYVPKSCTVWKRHQRNLRRQ